MKTIPFTAAHVEDDSAATMADLVVDPRRCEGAVLFHGNGRVMSFPAGRRPILGPEPGQGTGPCRAVPPAPFHQLTPARRSVSALLKRSRRS